MGIIPGFLPSEERREEKGKQKNSETGCPFRTAKSILFQQEVEWGEFAQCSHGDYWSSLFFSGRARCVLLDPEAIYLKCEHLATYGVF